MNYINLIFNWLNENKQWVFGGIGLSVIPFIIKTITKAIKNKRQRPPESERTPPSVKLEVNNSSGTRMDKISISIRSANKSREQDEKKSSGNSPPPPSIFIGRDDDLRKIKKRLGLCEKKEESSSVLQILTTVRGWPGVGKTALAMTLAHDKEIISHFSDGVFWISIGQEPKLLDKIVDLGLKLKADDILRSPTFEEAVDQLIYSLSGKYSLIILDDVWKADVVKPFKRACNPQCKLLVTTRKTIIARNLSSLSNDIYTLEVLSEKNALKLLKILAPNVVIHYPNESKKLIRKLEGLPLSIHVAGRLLEYKNSLVVRFIKLCTYLCCYKIKIFPRVNDRGRIDFGNSLYNPLAKFFNGLNSYMFQKSTGHFTEKRFDQIQPRTVLWRVNISKAIGSGSQIGLGFFGNM